jgi:hypothetical protein
MQINPSPSKMAFCIAAFPREMQMISRIRAIPFEACNHPRPIARHFCEWGTI